MDSSLLKRGDRVKEQFHYDNGKSVLRYGHILQFRKNGKVVIRFDDNSRYQYKRQDAMKLIIKKTLKRKTTVTSPPEKNISSASPSQQAQNLYDTNNKANSRNKSMCRQIMVSELTVKKKHSYKALVLDAEDMMFSSLLVIGNGFLPSNIDVPNCNDVGIINQMNTRGLANVHASYLGDFIRSIKNSVQYDILYLDYCSTPGSPEKKNSPIHDIQEIFKRKTLSKRSTLGVTVCMRNRVGNNIFYENKTRMGNAIIHAAFTNNYLAIQKVNLCYTDPGSQTMCFMCFDIQALN